MSEMDTNLTSSSKRCYRADSSGTSLSPSSRHPVNEVSRTIYRNRFMKEIISIFMKCENITVDQNKRKPTYVERDAVPEDDSEYRYSLSRHWDHSRPTVCYIGLNPSTATATDSDPTMTKLATAANMMGFGGMTLVNLFPVRSPNPSEIDRHDAPMGEDADRYIKRAADEAEAVFAAWGSKGEQYSGRITEVIELIDRDICVLDFNQDGSPLHGGARGEFYDRLSPQTYSL